MPCSSLECLRGRCQDSEWTGNSNILRGSLKEQSPLSWRTVGRGNKQPWTLLAWSVVGSWIQFLSPAFQRVERDPLSASFRRQMGKCFADSSAFWRWQGCRTLEIYRDLTDFVVNLKGFKQARRWVQLLASFLSSVIHHLLSHFHLLPQAYRSHCCSLSPTRSTPGTFSISGSLQLLFLPVEVRFLQISGQLQISAQFTLTSRILLKVQSLLLLLISLSFSFSFISI